MRKDAPTGAWLRSSRSQRLVGPGAVCVSCGKESRPYGLIFGRELPCCYRCERIAQGRPPYELNHVFGRRNSDLTIRYPVNDNTEHMLAEHKANSARLLHVEELLVTVYGLDWLPKLEAAAKRASRKAATKRKPHD